MPHILHLISMHHAPSLSLSLWSTHTHTHSHARIPHSIKLVLIQWEIINSHRPTPFFCLLAFPSPCWLDPPPHPPPPLSVLIRSWGREVCNGFKTPVLICVLRHLLRRNRKGKKRNMERFLPLHIRNKLWFQFASLVLDGFFFQSNWLHRQKHALTQGEEAHTCAVRRWWLCSDAS